MTFKKILLILWLMSPAILLAGNISELILPNGLKIIVKPDQRSPVAVIQVWYKVGSAYEREGNTGISHMLEHLMFKAGNNVILGQSFNQLSAVGAKGNGYTSRDHTFYYHILEKNHLALAFELEAERMQNLSPAINDFSIEKKIIREEFDTRINSDPYLPAYNALYQQAFKNKAYQFPVIGRPKDLDDLSLPKTMNWYKNHYTPDNATIVVVGDVNTSNVFQLAKKYFSPLTKSRQASHYYLETKEKTIVKEKLKPERLIVMPTMTEVAMILFAYKVPSIKTSLPDWEAYALEVLAGWIDSNTNSHLSKALINNKQLAYDISVRYSPMSKKNTLFILEAIPAYNVSLKQLKQSMNDAIRNIKNDLISQKNLLKIKTQMIATEIFERDSIYTQAKIIGQAESVGIHWLEDAQYISRIKAVTAEQIKKVLAKYFITSNEYIVIQNSHNGSALY
ncbi:MAG: pitrilysin family protein [Methylococcales bacterium]